MSRTVDGRDWMVGVMFDGTSRPAIASVLALSSNEDDIPSPENDWSTFGGAPGNEIAVDGLSRAVAVFAHTDGQDTATLQHTFTHTGPSGGGTPHKITKVAVVATGTPPGAADSGTFVWIMDEPNPPTLTGTDSLNQTVSFALGD